MHKATASGKTQITAAEAIRQAMEALAGEASIPEVRSRIEARYPNRWKDIGTQMTDLSDPASPSTQYPPPRRFLERLGGGRYRLRS